MLQQCVMTNFRASMSSLVPRTNLYPRRCESATRPRPPTFVSLLSPPPLLSTSVSTHFTVKSCKAVKQTKKQISTSFNKMEDMFLPQLKKDITELKATQQRKTASASRTRKPTHGSGARLTLTVDPPRVVVSALGAVSYLHSPALGSQQVFLFPLCIALNLTLALPEYWRVSRDRLACLQRWLIHRLFDTRLWI